MNLLHETYKTVRYHTNIRWVLEAMQLSAIDYDWFISDLYMCITMDGSKRPDDLESEDRWVTGEYLHETIQKHEILFTWGVFSAVPKGYRREVVDAPYADGNPGFWSEKGCGVQLDGALFEIVCWDGTATLLIGIDETAAANYKKVYPDARELRSLR